MAKVTKKITFHQLKKIKDKSLRKEVLEDIGEALIEGILDNVSQGKSPVQNGQYKKSLSKDYKKLKKGISGSSIANMELFGDMLDSLEVKTKGNTVEVGIFDEDQAAKAAGHNHAKGWRKSSLPKREFIPDSKRVFKRDIMREAKEIIADALADQEE